MQHFSFTQGKDSVLNSEEGRKKLQVAGIKNSLDVGDWLADTLEEHLDQDEMARKLRAFVHHS